MTKLQTALLLSDALCTLDRIEADIAQVKRDIRELALVPDSLAFESDNAIRAARLRERDP